MRGKYRKAIFVVVYRKSFFGTKYLLLKRYKHWDGWEFPKGGIENKESIEDCVKREIKEETGLCVYNIKKYNINGRYLYKKKIKNRKGLIGQTYVLFSGEVDKKNILIDKREHSGYKWVGFNTARKLLTWENQKKCLEIVDKNLK